MSPPYCTSQQAGQWLGPNNADDPYRTLTAVDPDADVLELGGHYLYTGDTFEVTARAGTIAGGLAERTDYYAIVLSPSRIQAAATLADAMAGIPIDITDEGDNMGVILRIPWDRLIAEEGALVDEMIIGSALPLPDGAAVPPMVSRLTSIMVAIRAANFTGQTSTTLMAHYDDAKTMFRDVYLKGKPIRNQAPPATNTAVSGPRLSGSATESRGWVRTIDGVEVL